MTVAITRSRKHTLAFLGLVIALTLIGAQSGRAVSTPIGPLPGGPVSTTTTRPGLLVAVALPHQRRGSGLVWRVARRYDSGVVRQVSEANVGTNVVLVFRVVGRGDTSLVFALTRGDVSREAIKAITQRIRSA
jgi:hypothetical protein